MSITSNQSSSSIAGTIDIASSQADDSIAIYGNDGTTNRQIKTDTSGNIQANILNSSDTVISPATETTLSSIDGKVGTATDFHSAGIIETASLGQIGAVLLAYSSGDSKYLPVTLSSGLDVNVINNPLTVENNGTFAVQATTPTKSSASLTNVSNSASNFTVFSSNSNAVARTITNDSSTDVYIKFGTTASTTSFVRKMVANEYYEFPQPLYTGQVDAIASSATGTLRIAEW